MLHTFTQCYCLFNCEIHWTLHTETLLYLYYSFYFKVIYL